LSQTRTARRGQLCRMGHRDVQSIRVWRPGGYGHRLGGRVSHPAEWHYSCECSWLDTWAAGHRLDASLSREAQGSTPVSMTDENLIAAIKLYRQHCAICHGKAKGEASASPLARSLPPASATGDRWRGNFDLQPSLRCHTSNGLGGRHRCISSF